jgi:hypothetical protein
VKPAARGADPSKEHRNQPLHTYLERWLWSAQKMADQLQRSGKPCLPGNTRPDGSSCADMDDPPEARDRNLKELRPGRQRCSSELVIGIP